MLGATLLIPVLAGFPFDQAVGAFMVVAALTLACRLLGWVDPILRAYLPNSPPLCWPACCSNSG